MKNRLRFCLVTFSLALMTWVGAAAYAQNPQTIEVGPHAGITSYIGELNTWRRLPEWNPLHQLNYEWGGVVRFNYDSRWAFRLDYTHLKVQACDTAAAWRPEAQLGFRSKVDDLSLMVEFNFLNYYTGRPEASISPYIFAGISGLRFDPRPYAIDTCLAPVLDAINLRTLRTEGDSVLYGRYALSIPFGVGCKFSLSKHLAATVEWRMHYTFTDRLDDVHGVYPANDKHALLVSTTNVDNQVEYQTITASPSDLTLDQTLLYDFTDPSGRFSEQQQRGNAQTNDWFGMINLSLTWKFVIPNNSACRMNVE